MLELEKQREHISPGLWHFNAGTVKAKMMNPAEARFHFLEARLHGFNNQKLSENLNLIEDQLEITTLEKPLAASDYAVKFGLWAEGGFFTMICLTIILAGLIIMKKTRKYYVLILTVLFAAVPLTVNFWVKSWDKSVALTPQQVMDGPSSIFGSRGELPPGIFLITRKAGEWKEVIYPSRFRGWIKNAGLKELE